MPKHSTVKVSHFQETKVKPAKGSLFGHFKVARKLEDKFYGCLCIHCGSRIKFNRKALLSLPDCDLCHGTGKVKRTKAEKRAEKEAKEARKYAKKQEKALQAVADSKNVEPAEYRAKYQREDGIWEPGTNPMSLANLIPGGKPARRVQMRNQVLEDSVELAKRQLALLYAVASDKAVSLMHSGKKIKAKDRERLQHIHRFLEGDLAARFVQPEYDAETGGLKLVFNGQALPPEWHRVIPAEYLSAEEVPPALPSQVPDLADAHEHSVVEGQTIPPRMRVA